MKIQVINVETWKAVWFDLADYYDHEDLMEAITEQLGCARYAITGFEDSPFKIFKFDPIAKVMELYNLTKNLDSRVVKTVTDYLGGDIQTYIDCFEQGNYTASIITASSLDALGQILLVEHYREIPSSWHYYLDGKKFIKDIKGNGTIIERHGAEYIVVTLR